MVALATIAAHDLIYYAALVSTLSAIAVIGAIWSAAKAWRERAEAREDEAEELREQNREQRERRAALEAKVAELERRTDVEALGHALREGQEQIRQMIRNELGKPQKGEAS